MILRPKTSNLLIVTIRTFGAKVTELLLVAFCNDLQTGHMYLLSFVSRSVWKNCSKASENVHSLPLGSGKLKVKVSSKVSLR